MLRIKEEISQLTNRQIIRTENLLLNQGDIININKLINSLLDRSYIYILNYNLIKADLIKVLIFTKLLKVASNFIQIKGYKRLPLSLNLYIPY